MSEHLECPSPCILRVQNTVYCWPGLASWTAGRCGCLRWFELLVAGLAAAAVNAVVLIWELARMDVLTILDDDATAEPDWGLAAQPAPD